MKNKMTEFNLSEKRCMQVSEITESYRWIYPEEDVKEFIRIDTQLIVDYMSEKINANEFWRERLKLMGEKLR